MQQEDLNVGIIGAGRVAHIHARSLQAVEGARLAGVADVDAARAEQFAAAYNTRSYRSVGALLQDKSLAAVVICSPTSAHADQAVDAAGAGKHILCEKPIAVTLADADRIIAAAERAGVYLMIGHVLRLMPEYTLAYSLLTSGELGQVRSLYARRMSGKASEAWQSWLLNSKFSLGVFDVQIHDLDLFSWIFGQSRSIISHGWQGPGGGWIHASSLLTYDEERWGIIESSFAVPQTYPFTMSLRAVGTCGTLEFLSQGESYARPTSRRLILYPSQGSPQDLTPPQSDAYTEQMRHFVTSIRYGQTPRHGHPSQARAALALALAAQSSVEKGGQPILLTE